LGRKEPILDLVTKGCDEEIAEEGMVETRSNEDGGGICMVVGIEMIEEVMGEVAASGSPKLESDSRVGEMGADTEILGGETTGIIGRERLIKKGESPAAWSLDGS
jgi:hypothetical protein